MGAIILSAKKVAVIGAAVLVAFAAYFIGSYFWQGAIATSSQPVNGEPRVINLVTGEFKAETADGKEIEAYRWDPGTIFVEKGEPIKLSIYGVNGKEHPFFIEGTDVKGVVQQGKETIVDLKFDKEGVYRLICNTHPDINSNGPMIAYIVVD
ncbi:Cupredoxin-like domain-containing protein [Halobacillus alkaliphilus]|uniref:Cupredoxin-like domain-containing protein n=1 Tax=Halobacillus alkaliphilus TaxID=396056 RepID=A0A1I2LZZ2_9BACI|nr:cupredoxin domain-containing protein [Halobacillus alkaliphilus]SFF84059.1 Cupredoxin-like domain-containing protein [Halobacillus alkaliphilus]